MEQSEQNAETPKITVARNAMNFGAMLGIALVVLSLLLYILNMNEQTWVYWIQLAIIVTGIVIGTISYRNNYCGGYISYGKSLGSGVLIGLFASLILGFYVYVFFNFIDPEAISQIILKSEDKILSQNPDMSDEQLETIMVWQKRFMTPVWMAVFGIINNVFMSFICSLITSIFTRKVDKSFEANFR